MTVFSTRNGYNNTVQFEYASNTLKRKIYTRFFAEEFVPDSMELVVLSTNYSGIEKMMVEMGVPLEFPQNQIIKNNNAKALERYIENATEWYTIYDFIERYLNICDKKKLRLMRDEFNRILEDEASAYRIVDKIVVPITNKSELATIDEAKHTKYDAVNKHIEKALELYANRQNPDYENSIKDSISAVESMCCIITGLSGPTATLGKTIKKLKDYGIHIHPAMESAFSSLYGYTSDEDGIRHGGMDFTNAPAEDAKYMLVSCSAFINYLIEKLSKAGIE